MDKMIIFGGELVNEKEGLARERRKKFEVFSKIWKARVNNSKVSDFQSVTSNQKRILKLHIPELQTKRLLNPAKCHGNR